MKRENIFRMFFLLAVLSTVSVCCPASAGSKPAERMDKGSRFSLTSLTQIKVKDGSGKSETLYDPRDPYVIFINYELGMHCVGFDISYCCIIPPYNSIQAQAVRTGMKGALPRLLSPDDGISLAYSVRDNSYSEGNKMKYWQVPKDVYGNGRHGRSRRFHGELCLDSPLHL